MINKTVSTLSFLLIGQIFFPKSRIDAANDAHVSMTLAVGLLARVPPDMDHHRLSFDLIDGVSMRSNGHPWTEAMAGIVSDLPVKFMVATCFNIILYFLAGLRAEPSNFFIYFLFTFVATLTMSSIFRSLAAFTKTISQAMALAGVMVLAIVIYTGFTLPRPYEHPWMRWISWINPIAYAFEAILVNEVHGREFPCAQLVPTAPYQQGDSFRCAVAGAQVGRSTVNGDDWVQSSYGYSYSHIWRNLGFMFAFQIFFLFVYLLATEYNSTGSSTAEVLVFRRGRAPKKALE